MDSRSAPGLPPGRRCCLIRQAKVFRPMEGRWRWPVWYPPSAVFSLGRLIDAGLRVKRAVLFNGILLIAMLLLKASAGPQLGSMLGITAVSALLGASYMPILMTAIYSLAAKAPCPLRFIFATEGAWDIGQCTGQCFITAFSQLRSRRAAERHNRRRHSRRADADVSAAPLLPPPASLTLRCP